MYGKERLNNHEILKYGLTIEFCRTFNSLKYMDIELPYVLLRHFHVYIKPFVNKNLRNTAYVRRIQQKYRIYTMANVQNSLKSSTKKLRNLSKYSYRNTILMSGVFTSFALDQFTKNNVILVNANHHDDKAIKAALNGGQLPQNIEIFNFNEKLKKTIIPKKEVNKLLKQLKKILIANRKHKLFGTPMFKRWIYKNLFRSLRRIQALELLIRKKPIGVILDHVEITYPGNILSLIALKYNLPFLLAPQVLLTDRSVIPTRASKYLVWGNNYKNWFNKRGIKPSKIKVTGNLKFEYEKKVQLISKSDFIDTTKIPNDHLIITFTTQTFSKKINYTIMNWIIKAVSSLPITVIIKPHPADSTDYTRYLKYPNIKLAPQTHVYNILRNSDFVMTISSNTAIEAATFNKGIIVLQPKIPYEYEHHNNDFNAFLVKSNAGLVAHNYKELRKHFEKLKKNKKFRETVVEKGQRFLSETLNTHITPSIMTRRIIQSYLKK